MNWELLKPRNAVVIIILALVSVYIADRIYKDFVK
jgi:hypothetical protein